MFALVRLCCSAILSIESTVETAGLKLIILLFMVVLFRLASFGILALLGGSDTFCRPFVSWRVEW
jgi:hypothetical protein